MKIAIPVDEDKGMRSLVSGHMGHAKLFLVYDSGTKALSRVPIGADEPGMCVPVGVLGGLGIRSVFLLDAGQRALAKMSAMGITPLTGSCRTVSDVVAGLGKLKPLEQGCGH
jgi:predicted Fe-Mo cluster-binding NifX family protein